MFEKIFGEQHCPGCNCFEQPEPEIEDEETEEEVPMANEPDPQTAPHTHEWSLWEIVNEGNITRSQDDTTWTWGEKQDHVIGTYLDQRRRCVSCGKYELDTQVSYAIED